MEEDKLCECCNARPVAGYHNRLGFILDRLCYKCFIRHPEEIRPVRHSSVIGNRAGAKS